MADRIACEICGKPVANWEDYEGAEPTEPLCWAEANGGHSPQHAIDALRASRADLARLRALLAAYGRAVEVEEEQWSNGTEAAYIEAAAAADTAMKAIQTEAAKWREWG